MMHFTLMWGAVHWSGGFIVAPMTCPLKSVTTSTPLSVSVLKLIIFCLGLTAWSPARDGQKITSSVPNIKHFPSSPRLWPFGNFTGPWRKNACVHLMLLSLPISASAPAPALHCNAKSSCALRPTTVHKHLRFNGSRYWEESNDCSKSFHTEPVIRGSYFISHPHPCLLPHTHQRNIGVLYNTYLGEIEL